MSCRNSTKLPTARLAIEFSIYTQSLARRTIRVLLIVIIAIIVI